MNKKLEFVEPLALFNPILSDVFTTCVGDVWIVRWVSAVRDTEYRNNLFKLTTSLKTNLG